MQTAYYKFDRDTQFAKQRIRAARKARFRVFKRGEGYEIRDRLNGSWIAMGGNRDQMLKEAAKWTDRYMMAGMQNQVEAGQGKRKE